MSLHLHPFSQSFLFFLCPLPEGLFQTAGKAELTSHSREPNHLYQRQGHPKDTLSLLSGADLRDHAATEGSEPDLSPPPRLLIPAPSFVLAL